MRGGGGESKGGGGEGKGGGGEGLERGEGRARRERDKDGKGCRERFPVCRITCCLLDDDNRVELKPLKASEEYQNDYINASYIDVRVLFSFNPVDSLLLPVGSYAMSALPRQGYSCPRKYVATQGMM